MFRNSTIFTLLMLAILARAIILPGEISIESFDNLNSRIASGAAGKKGENLDFCYVNVQFFQKRQICGCFVISQYFIMTSARCVVDCSEKTATNVTVTFPQKSGKDVVQRVVKVYVPDGVNGAAKVEKYDETMEVPFNSFHAGSNVALLELQLPIALDQKSAAVSTIVDEETVDELLTRAALADYKYRACGVGTIDNKGTFSKGVFCTDVNLVPSDQCKNPNKPAEAYEVPETFACLQWPNVDKNLCVGDFGGPVWIYQLDPKGAAINQEVFCVAVGSPDVRSSATCLDGHTVYCQFISTPIFDWAQTFYNPDGLGQGSKYAKRRG